VGRRELADSKRQSRDVLFAGDLIWPILDGLLLSAKADGLAHEETSDVEARRWKIRLLRFAIGVSADAVDIAEAEALHQLGVHVDFGSGPWPIADEGGCTDCIGGLVLALKAICSLVGRSEARVTLLYEGELSVDVPI